MGGILSGPIRVDNASSVVVSTELDASEEEVEINMRKEAFAEKQKNRKLANELSRKRKKLAQEDERAICLLRAQLLEIIKMKV